MPLKFLETAKTQDLCEQISKRDHFSNDLGDHHVAAEQCLFEPELSSQRPMPQPKVSPLNTHAVQAVHKANLANAEAIDPQLFPPDWFSSHRPHMVLVQQTIHESQDGHLKDQEYFAPLLQHVECVNQKSKADQNEDALRERNQTSHEQIYFHRQSSKSLKHHPSSSMFARHQTWPSSVKVNTQKPKDHVAYLHEDFENGHAHNMKAMAETHHDIQDFHVPISLGVHEKDNKFFQENNDTLAFAADNTDHARTNNPKQIFLAVFGANL